MGDACGPDSLGDVASLERTHDPALTPALGSTHQLTRKSNKIRDFQREPSQGIAGERVESGRDQNEVRQESRGRGVDGLEQSIHINPWGEPRGHWHVPYRVVGAAIPGCARAWVPGPLVHRDEMNAWVALDERLCAVAMVHVPGDDQHAIEPVLSSGIESGQGDVAKETEADGFVFERVMAWGAHRAQASLGPAVERSVYAI